MRQIRVSYRAIFEQPINKLNPMGLRLTAQWRVEVYRMADKWVAGSLDTHRPFTALGKLPSATATQLTVEANFERMIEPWQVWAEPPNLGQPKRMLEPWEFQHIDGKTYWKEPEDFTHIIHAPSVQPGERIPRAACGAKVKAQHFVNNLANVERSCRACAEVWRAHYRKPA